MAKRSIPSALDMRRLKYGEASDAEREATASALRAAGRRAELLLLFERHPDPKVFAEEADWAVKEGQAFHLLSVQRLGGDVSEDRVRACAKRALEKGRAMDARNCYTAIGDEAAIAAMGDLLPESMRPAPAPGLKDPELKLKDPELKDTENK